MALVLTGLSISAQAACVGTGAFQHCTDDRGNSYGVQRYGNTTHVQGNNAANGTNWNQTSQTYGNTTHHSGTASNGQSWNGTATNIGGTTFHNGTDSRGNLYSKTCNSYGCF